MQRQNKIKTFSKNNKIFFTTKSKQTIVISEKHKAYTEDMKNYFYYYYKAVKTKNKTADFSVFKKHLVRGFKLFPIWFPSIPEPLSTTKEILKFANLKKVTLSLIWALIVA